MTSTANFDVRIVLTTIGSEADGISIAKTLVDEGLAACVNVLPQMISIYRWKGSVEQDGEHQIVIKTTAERLAALEPRLRNCIRTSCRNSWSSIRQAGGLPTSPG